MRFWESLDDELQQMMSMSPQPSALCALKEKKQEQDKNDAHQDESRDPVISSTIHNVLEKERAPLPQVATCMMNNCEPTYTYST